MWDRRRSLTQRGARKTAAIPAPSATAAAALRATAGLDTARHRAAEQAGRPYEEHDQDHEQRDRQAQLIEVEVDVLVVGRDQIEPDAEGETADDGAERALETSEHGRREGVDEDRAHHVRVERGYRRRGEEPGDRADRRREAPADPEHPPHADAHEPAGGWAQRRGAEGKPELG